MANRNQPPLTTLPLPPLDHDVQYLNNLIRLLNNNFSSLKNPGDNRSSTQVFTDAPTAPADQLTGQVLEDGTVWNDSGFLKLLPQGNPGTCHADFVIVDPASSTEADVANIQVLRNANYVGGDPAAYNAAILARTIIGEGVGTSEIAIVGTIDNYATSTSSFNAGIYGLGNKYPGAGVTYGGVLHFIDRSGGVDPTSGEVSLAAAHTANGTDANKNRAAINVTLSKADSAGAMNTVSYGVRISAYAYDLTQAEVISGFAIAGCNYTYGVDLVDGTMNTGGAAVRIHEDTSIIFKGTADSNYLFYNSDPAIESLEYNPGTITTPSANYVRFTDTGDVKITGSYYSSGSAYVSGGAYIEGGTLWQYAPTPASASSATTLTAADLKTGIISATGTTYTITLPTGSDIDSAFSGIPTTDIGFNFSVISGASGVITIAVGASGMSSVGGLTIAAGASAQFRLRRTAANTYVLYRIS